MKKIRAAVVGYGNIGRYTVQALEAANDFEIAGIVRRNGAENKPAELAQYDVVRTFANSTTWMWLSSAPPPVHAPNLQSKSFRSASTLLIVLTFTQAYLLTATNSCLSVANTMPCR